MPLQEGSGRRPEIPPGALLLAGPGGAWTRIGRSPARGRLRILRNRGEPSGFSRFVAPLMASQIRRANRKDLQRLKEILEARKPE